MRAARPTTDPRAGRDLYNPFATNKFLGLGPEDPTAAPLPAALDELPPLPSRPSGPSSPGGPSSPSRPLRFELPELSHQQLMAYAARTARFGPRLLRCWGLG
jgi:hypothetical protein